MEKERLALEKIKLEFKQQRFLRRQEVKQHKIDKEFKLRELEIDIKAKEIEQKETLNQLYQRYQQETVSLVKTLVQRSSQWQAVPFLSLILSITKAALASCVSVLV